MTIWRLLRYFAIGEPEQHTLVDESAPLLAVYRKPGMHQIFYEPDELALTPDDREFLRKLGIWSDFRGRF